MVTLILLIAGLVAAICYVVFFGVLGGLLAHFAGIWTWVGVVIGICFPVGGIILLIGVCIAEWLIAKAGKSPAARAAA